MKLKILTFLLLIFFLKTASAQTDTFKILLGEEDIAITQYYKRLMNLFPDNNYLKIEKNLDEDGNKLLILELPTYRYGKVGFIMTFSRFLRLEDTREICTEQGFSCDNSSAVEYLSYIKDNYKSAGLNKWTKEFNEIFDIMVEFKRGEGSISTISLYLKGKTK
jgi:hypothetical protein